MKNTKLVKWLMMFFMMMMENAHETETSIGLKQPNSNNPKSSSKGKNNRHRRQPQVHNQHKATVLSQNPLNSRQCFMLTIFNPGPPEIIFNKKSEPVAKTAAWKQIFVNTTLFVMVSSTFHPKVYINWPGNGPQKKDPLDAALAQSIHDTMGGSTWFSGIPPLAALLTAYQTAIDTWNEKIATALKGTQEDKDNLKTYSNNFRKVTSARLVELVQGVADAHQLNAQSVAESASMELKGVGGKSEQIWSVTRVSEGSVELVGAVKHYRSKRYTIQWQMTSTPENGESWWLRANAIPPTPMGKTTVAGLPKNVDYFFRYRVTLTDGSVSDWSNTISISIS